MPRNNILTQNVLYIIYKFKGSNLYSEQVISIINLVTSGLGDGLISYPIDIQCRYGYCTNDIDMQQA